MKTPNRPVVTAEYSRAFESEELRDSAGGLLRTHTTPGVTVEVEFTLHDHASALALLDKAVADVRAQIEETR